MEARIVTDSSSGDKTGILELGLDDGYHVGTIVMLTLDKDGVPTVTIDTPQDTETHEVMDVFMNDAKARWF